MKTLFVMVKCDLGRAEAVGSMIVNRTGSKAEAYSITGNYDLLVKTEFQEIEEVAKFVQEFLHSIPGIKDTYTFVSFKAYGDFTADWVR
jgi:DNA-binding Lrp family transcriptional regulator